MKMNKNILKNYIIGTIIGSIILFAAFYLFGYLIVAWLNEINFYSLAENAHFTVYNTPHVIMNAFWIDALQSNVTFLIAIIPVVIWNIGVIINFIYDYRTW